MTTEQPDLWTWFDGETYDPALDEDRLRTQLGRVYAALAADPDRWWTLHDLAVEAAGSEAGVSARLRDLRKPRFGAHQIEARRVQRGLWAYRLQRRGAR